MPYTTPFALDQSQRLLEICDDILRIFNPHRQANKARRHTRGVLLSCNAFPSKIEEHPQQESPAGVPYTTPLALDQSQRLLQVRDDVLRILDAYRQADKARRHTRGVLLS